MTLGMLLALVALILGAVRFFVNDGRLTAGAVVLLALGVLLAGVSLG